MANEFISSGEPLGAGVCNAMLKNAALLDTLVAYRRRIAGNYRSLPSDEVDKLAPGKMLVSTKLDGELWFLVSWDNEVFLVNTRGRTIAGDVPILKQAHALPNGTVVAGELYARVEGRRARVGDLAAAMSGAEKARTGDICFAGFDLLQEYAMPVVAAYEAKHQRLGELLGTTANLSTIPITTAHTAANVRALFDAKVATGEAEGLVIRLDSGLIYKLKPSISIDAAIIAYTVKSDQPGLVRSILLGLMREDGRMQILGGCGNIGSDDDRRALLPTLEKSKVESSVRYASESGSLYTFLKPELVAEIQVTDLQSDRSDNSTAASMVIGLTDLGWQGYGMQPSPRLIHSVLVRIRDDKKVGQTDVRVSQIDGYLSSAAGDRSSGNLPSSTVLRREVWTKEAKGQTAVRKLLIWKTNKEDIDRTYPAYVVHWTDYSSSRASALDREVRRAPDELEAMKIADSMVVDNIKKGWTKVS